MGGETPTFNPPSRSFWKALKCPETDHPMMSRPSPYSSVVHVPTMVVPSHTKECECRRPRLCPSSWPATANSRLPLIQAREGLPPTVADPVQPQAFGGKTYTRCVQGDKVIPAAVPRAST